MSRLRSLRRAPTFRPTVDHGCEECRNEEVRAELVGTLIDGVENRSGRKLAYATLTVTCPACEAPWRIEVRTDRYATQRLFAFVPLDLNTCPGRHRAHPRGDICSECGEAIPLADDELP